MKAWILVAFALIGALPVAADSYTYQTISLPGAPVGISRVGDIAGNYTDSGGMHGYVDASGIVTTLATGYSVINLNQDGELLLKDAAGFATYANGSYSQIVIPASLPPGFPPQITNQLVLTPTAINDAGQVLAVYDGYNIAYPVLISTNQLTQLGSIPFDSSESQVTLTGVNDAGVAVATLTTAVHAAASGTYAEAGLYNPAASTWTFVSDNNASETYLNAVNNSGQAVGADIYYQGPPDFAVEYLNGVFISVAPPGSTYSTALGINDAGTILGSYGYDSPTYFLATPTVVASPVPEPSFTWLSVIGLAALAIYNKLGKRFVAIAKGVCSELWVSSFASG